ncbi:AraC family transcriptional regulator [Streptomyces sp. SID3343]|uniref:AraC family transcriptional regulator n=1 Tax=Streptomyces sp. SID3343 TaxID=2690260 RepID=UPI001370A6DD|nr:AraC family transcriptional regulator [Streptomyces sp. SID3343]MYV98884.1 helix-turn-helix domain-containing protein [Streptomyces sp. SID3343]
MRTESSSNPFSGILPLSDAHCVIARGITAAGQWAVDFPPPGRLKLHAVVEGSIRLSLGTQRRTRLLVAGDVVVFDGGSPFAIGDGSAVSPVHGPRMFARSVDPFVRQGDGRGEGATAVGGVIDLRTIGQDLLLETLPPLIHLRAGTEGAARLIRLLGRLVEEANSVRLGAGFAADQLTRLICIEVWRAHLAEADAPAAAWLRALADERLVPALRLIHDQPARPWRLDELARAAAMSRTAFAGHFKAIAGVPPLRYLHDRRIHQARQALHLENTSVTALALELGYTSPSAFSHAFKRATGMAPRQYREAIRAA